MTDDPNQQTLETFNDTDTDPTHQTNTNTTDHTTTGQEHPPQPDDQPNTPTEQTHHQDTNTDTPTDDPTTTTTSPSTPDDPTPDAHADSPFDFTRGDLDIDPDHALTEQAVNELVGDSSPSPPLADQITTLATHAPKPTSTESRFARMCYMLARAQTGALRGYNLRDSMIPLRDHIEAELDISFADAIAHEIITEKRVLGQEKYFRLTDHARESLHAVDHPNPGVLDDTTPILRDGPIHNRSVLEGADWLRETQNVTRVETPYFDADRPVDLAGFRDGHRVWLGEAVAAEDDFNAVSTSIGMLRDLDAKVLVIVEDSSVAVALFDALDAAGLLDIPPDITYRKYSVAQFRERLYPEVDALPFDRLTALSTLL